MHNKIFSSRSIEEDLILLHKATGRSARVTLELSVQHQISYVCSLAALSSHIHWGYLRVDEVADLNGKLISLVTGEQFVACDSHLSCLGVSAYQFQGDLINLTSLEWLLKRLNCKFMLEVIEIKILKGWAVAGVFYVTVKDRSEELKWMTILEIVLSHCILSDSSAMSEL